MVVPWPGMSTIESRGIDISTFGPLPVCSSMIVSVRWPWALPVPSALRSSALRPARESLPTRRYVVPGWPSGRAPSGSKATLSTLVHAKTGTATRKTTQSSSTTSSQRSRSAGGACRGRRRNRRTRRARGRAWAAGARPAAGGRAAGGAAGRTRRPGAGAVAGDGRHDAGLVGARLPRHRAGGLVVGVLASCGALRAVEPVVLGGPVRGTAVSPGTISHVADATVQPCAPTRPPGPRRTPACRSR